LLSRSWLFFKLVSGGPMSEKHHIIPVWFFVGVLFLVYGVLIFVSGLAEWSHPPNTVLANLHAPVWWGGLLIALGVLYVGIFRPGRAKM
jgi:hypothetical protein